MSHITDELWSARQLHEKAANAKDIIESQGDAKLRRVIGSGTKARGIKLHGRIHATTRGIAKITLFGKYVILDDYAVALNHSRTVIDRARRVLSYRIELHLMYSVD